MTTFPPIDLPPPRKGTGPLAAIAADANEFRKALKMLDDRTRALFPHPSPSIRPSVTPAGTTYTAAGGARPAREQLLPFECFTRSVPSETETGTFIMQLVGAPGTIGEELIEETIEEDPADGTWYFYTRVTIDATTGATTEVIAQWFDAVQVNTPTVGHQLMNAFEVVDGNPTPAFVEGINFGPVYFLVKGGVDDKWEVVVI
jgi:hypothetical protein